MEQTQAQMGQMHAQTQAQMGQMHAQTLAQMGQMQAQMGQMQAALRQLAILAARSYNASALQNDAVLEPLTNDVGQVNVLFPLTRLAAERLLMAHVNALLAFYGLADGGNLGQKRSRFSSFIGIR
jgi:hypothetical protein